MNETEGKMTSSVPVATLRRWPAFVVLVAGLMVTLLATWRTIANVRDALRRQCDFASQEISLKVRERLQAHEQILRGGAGLFSAVGMPTRAQWRSLLESMQVEHRLPGVQGVGYTHRILKADLERHTAEIRSQGFPSYRVWPEGDREVYTSIIYLEPFTNRNLRAFGYDMRSEGMRRKAMDRAADLNAAALSGKVKLVQETTNDVQAGTLMYVPVYRQGMPLSTVEERRSALQGWVYSPYRMNDLMQGILGGWEASEGHRIRLQVFDSPEPVSDTLLYDSQRQGDLAGGSGPENGWGYTVRSPIAYAGQMWTMVFTQSEQAMTAMQRVAVWGVAGVGFLLSGLLAGLLHSSMNTRFNAERLAERLTANLRHTTERLGMATEAGGVGIWEYSVGLGRLTWDDQMFRLYGISRDRFGGVYDSWKSSVHPEDRERADLEIQKALSGEREFNTEFRICLPDGSVRYLRAQSRVQRDSEGQPMRVVGTNWDITERRLAEAELMRSLAAERELSALKSTFVSMVSHEFRTPLGAILAASEMLEDYYERLEFAKRKAYFQLIRQEVQRLTGMLQDVLLQGQLDAGRVTCKLRPVDMHALCRSVATRVQGAFPKHPPVQCDFDPPGPRTLLDEVLVERMLDNLLTNAFKYSPGLTPVKLQVRHHQKEWRIEVQDQGMGIPETDLGALFSAFCRGGNVGNIKGTGVGLYIVKKCAELQGGRVGVVSDLGRGTTFWVQLPWNLAEGEASSSL